MYVLDATPLIYLAKAGGLSLVSDLPSECCTPEQVHEEVVTTGIDEGYADARRIERIVEDGVLDVVAVDERDTFERLRHNQNLSAADAAVLTVADERDATAVMDEQYGRTVADAEGIATLGTVYLVLRSLEADRISAETARETIDAMMDAGWYCAPDLYARILRRIDDLG
jgi:predicted nucleic acid-binding protein